MPHRFLLIDDDPSVAAVLREALKSDFPGELVAVLTGNEGFRRALEETFDLIILDLTLPDLSGLDVCKALQEKGVRAPIMLLTSRGEELDKVLGFELGADDYIVKPFSPRELVGRIKAILRRVNRAAPAGGEDGAVPTVIDCGELKIDTESRSVHLKGARVEISRTEFEILWLLASHPGKTFSRDLLVEEILGYEAGDYDHALTTHISRLRGKLEEFPEQPKYIQTVRGIGYRFAKKDDAPDP